MSPIQEQRTARLEQIAQVEQIIGGPVIVYFTADSPIVHAAIAEDAPRPIFDHLQALRKQNRLGLYLYSLGGTMETPWKIVTMLREFCDELYVIVPYKAYSAATMIAIGADKIYMTRKGELGPIDPSLQIPARDPSRPRLQDLGVEDIAAYLTFMRERAKLTDQAALAQVIGALAQDLTPPLLGRIERTYSHIRLVARNLLSLHKPPLDDRQVSQITEALTEKIYTHGHGIGRREAERMGLDVVSLNEAEELAVWRLYESYESVFRLRDSRDVESYFPAGSDLYEQLDTAIACVESVSGLHAFVGMLRAQRTRNIPPNPAINVNLNLSLPPGVNPGQLSQELRGLLQNLLQQAGPEIQRLVAQELQRQSPTTGFSVSLVGGAWRRLA